MKKQPARSAATSVVFAQQKGSQMTVFSLLVELPNYLRTHDLESSAAERMLSIHLVLMHEMRLSHRLFYAQ
jgi:hypothetical protein